MVFGSRTRRAVLGCCVALALTGSTAHSASATPPPAGSPLPAGLVEAVRRDLGIDAREYLQRAEAAERLLDFAKRARSAFPTAFAGIRMDGRRPIVSLADGERAADAVQAAEQAGFTVETVTDSERTLNNRRIAFERWLSQQPESIVDSIIGYGIDVVSNSLAVRVTKDVRLPTEAGPIRSVAAVLPDARPDDSPGGLREIAGIEAEGDIIGGQPFGIELNGKTHRCSFGFNATDAEGNTVNITAGHCDPNNLVEGSARSAEPKKIYEYNDGQLGDEIGYFDVSKFAPNDYAIVRINEEFAPRFQNNLVSTHKMDSPAQAPDVDTSGLGLGGSGGGTGGAGSNAQPPTGSGAGQPRLTAPGAEPAEEVLKIDGTTEPVAGAAVCKSGFTSGYSCGTVLVAGQKGLLRGVPGHGDEAVETEDMFYAALCGQRGDSGGPIFAGTKAVGVSSAIITVSTPFDLGCGHVPLLLGQPISTVLEENPGLTVHTNGLP